MTQLSWLPEKIARVEPNPVQSADSPGIGVARSHQRYVLKVAYPGHPYLPASEWASHALAFALGLPVPHWCLCELPDGRHCFGSRIEGAVLGTQVLPVDLSAFANPEVMGGAFVLDLLLGNDDRHPGNWLVTGTGGAVLLRPIDFSRALLWRWPPNAVPPWSADSNSTRYYTLAWTAGQCQPSDGRAMFQQIHTLEKSVWANIVESVPPDWLAEPLRRELINWWWSPIWWTRMKWIESQL
ncbi:MAG: hypothetical protein RL268_83 [Pseudomonadota bacterium]|jgi:hypothetical protein